MFMSTTLLSPQKNHTHTHLGASGISLSVLHSAGDGRVMKQRRQAPFLQIVQVMHHEKRTFF